MIHMLHITQWHPARLNQWEGRHWSVKNCLKKADREMVGTYAILVGIPKASGKRRITLTLTLSPRQRGGDPDAYWKSLLDALAACGLLVDDNRQNVELAPVLFQRGKERATTIVLEDL